MGECAEKILSCPANVLMKKHANDTILCNDEDIRIDIEDEHIFYIKALPMAASSPSTKSTASSEFKYEIMFMLDPTETSAPPEMMSGNKGKDKANIEGTTPSDKILLPHSSPAKRSLFQNPDEQPKTANKKVEKIVGDKEAAALPEKAPVMKFEP